MKEIFEGKIVFITGGTGYLGKALTREILKYGPKEIRVFSRDEVKHYKYQIEFKNDRRLRNIVGDVRDFHRLRRAMIGSDIVIHAAALKRIDLIEYNVEESIKTNVLGTLNVVNAIFEENVERAIFISTDKACSPVNAYGACKFISERIFTESNFTKANRKTIFNAVRYGNVWESTGSVIPFFKEKIRRGEKIPLTDARMTRFIITPTQAVHLIFDALRYGRGGEVFVPRLPAFRVTDLIDILKENLSADNEIEVIGLRPGEKIHEIMLNFSEIPRTYAFRNRFVISSAIQGPNNRKKPVYKVRGRLLTEKDMTEYSSGDNVISKTELKKIFTELELL